MYEKKYYTEYISPVGKLTIVSDEENIIGLWIEGQKYFCSTIQEEIIRKDNLPILKIAKKWLDKYFNNEKPKNNEIPYGGEFRQLVWNILCQIPYGEITTYGEIAKKVAKMQGKKTMSAQAIGGAVGHNPISIIIPCHRVIGTNGKLTGYAAGVKIKKQLIDFENKA